MQSPILIALSCSLIWSCQGSSFLSLWETTCKVHSDSRHNELKELMKNQEKFNTGSWSHSILMVLLILITSIILVGCCLICYQCSPLCAAANRLRNINKLIPINAPQHHQPHLANNPYPVPYTGRTLQLRELPPSQQQLNSSP